MDASCGGGLEEEEDRGLVGGASTWPFIDCPFEAISSELEASEAGDSLAFGSEEEVAILPSGYDGGFSSSKKRGEVDGGEELELEAVARGDSLGFQQLTSSSHPFSRMVPDNPH